MRPQRNPYHPDACDTADVEPEPHYEPARPCAPRRYSAPHGFRRLGSSLSPAGWLNKPT